MIYFQRHGESETNVSKIFTCRTIDPDLTENGIRQLENKARYFIDKKIRKIISSPSKRALQSAGIIAESLGLDVVKNDDLLEIDVGDLEGQSEKVSENLELFFGRIEDWFQNGSENKFPGGESKSDLVKRVQCIFSDLEHDSIYVSHTGFIACAMALNGFTFNTVQDLFLPRAGTIRYDAKTNRWAKLNTDLIE